jgi:hypothetical protein
MYIKRQKRLKPQEAETTKRSGRITGLDTRRTIIPEQRPLQRISKQQRSQACIWKRRMLAFLIIQMIVIGQPLLAAEEGKAPGGSFNNVRTRAGRTSQNLRTHLRRMPRNSGEARPGV